MSLTKTTLPQTETFETLLAVCGIPPAKRAPWRAALERARTADVRRPTTAVRVRAVNPQILGVHGAIQVGAQQDFLPRYVERDLDEQIRTLVNQAATAGGFVLLIGGSSVGKTRSLYEAVRAQLPDWWLFQPATAADLDREAVARPQRTVIWLDEIYQYLSSSEPLRAATMRSLLTPGVVVVATIWPQDYDAAATSEYATDATRDARALLNLATAVVVPADFTSAERSRAEALAKSDARLEAALDAGQPGVTQILAAAPDLLRRWEESNDPYGAAMITAAVDARRLGMLEPLTVEHLRAATPGYLTDRTYVDASADWLERALAYATEKLRGAASALIPHRGGTVGQVRGYTVADYILQRAYETRRAATLPETAWRALVTHADDEADLRRLARSADGRWRYAYAVPLYAKLSDGGDEGAAGRLADLLSAEQPEEAINILRPFSSADHVAGKVIDLLAAHGDIDALREASRSGDLVAACRLLDLTAATDVQQLRAAAGAGDILAAAWLVDHDGDESHLQQLRQRAAGGDRLARGRLAEALAERGRLNEALNLLPAAGDPADRLAADHRIDLQLRHGLSQQQLRDLATAGDEAADSALVLKPVRGGHTAVRIAGALSDLGQQDQAIAVLQAHDAALVELTDDYLVDLLVLTDSIDLLREIAATGEWTANSRLAQLAADSGDLERLRQMEDEGNWFATRHILQDMINRHETDAAIEYAKTHAATGNIFAISELLDLLFETGQELELQRLAQTDPWYASGRWTDHLVAMGRRDEAIQWLRDQRGDGADLAAEQLATILTENDQLEEALDILRPHTNGYGEGPSVNLLVELLHKHQRLDDLRLEGNAGAHGAMEKLLDLLITQGAIDQHDAEQVRRRGVSAPWPADGTPP